MVKSFVSLLPGVIVERFRALRKVWYRTPIGRPSFGDLRNVSPIGVDYGYRRGTPVDRYYIERFMGHFASDVRGRVLEIKDDAYTVRYGRDRVTEKDILDVDPENPRANIIADLTDAKDVPSDTYDCVIFTQVLHLIYESRAAIETIHRILKPGGVVLATVPGLCRIGEDELPFCHYAFTRLSMQRMFGEFFEDIQAHAQGNALTAVAFIHGVALEELDREEMDHNEPGYEIVVTIRAVKPKGDPAL